MWKTEKQKSLFNGWSARSLAWPFIIDFYIIDVKSFFMFPLRVVINNAWSVQIVRPCSMFYCWRELFDLSRNDVVTFRFYHYFFLIKGLFMLAIYYAIVIVIAIRFQNGFFIHFCDCDCDCYSANENNCNHDRVINRRCELTIMIRLHWLKAKANISSDLNLHWLLFRQKPW